MATVYMIPAILHEEGIAAIPAYILEAVRDCQVLFVENERTARRYLKLLDKAIVIDSFEWHVSEAPGAPGMFRQRLKDGKNIGILSEAGCPGVADPGQQLAAIAQEMNIAVKPLVGPNSILLALMGSGMNGQQFQFVGYLPIDNQQRAKTIRDLEAESQKKKCTQVFIETPYRNNQLVETLLKTCRPNAQLCIAVDITATTEWIKTKTIESWKKEPPNIHKRPAIFLLLA
jgi:16S rRNA (cytidine1402-2'-O)-methyltransferase